MTLIFAALPIDVVHSRVTCNNLSFNRRLSVSYFTDVCVNLQCYFSSTPLRSRPHSYTSHERAFVGLTWKGVIISGVKGARHRLVSLLLNGRCGRLRFIHCRLLRRFLLCLVKNRSFFFADLSELGHLAPSQQGLLCIHLPRWWIA